MTHHFVMLSVANGEVETSGFLDHARNDRIVILSDQREPKNLLDFSVRYHSLEMTGLSF